MNHSNNFNKAERIDALTGARFTAIMIIVFSHFEFLKNYDQFGNVYWSFFHNATMGVDFFFMLSGFGMMLSSIRKDPEGIVAIGGVKGLISFAKRHVQKIYPVYVVSLFLGIPYMLLTECIVYGKTIGRQILKCLVFLSADLTLLQTAIGKTILSHSLNGVCWFLSSLFCIYLVSPLIMRFLKRRVKTAREAWIGISVSIIISFVLAITFSYVDNHTIFDDLCYGSPYRRVFYVIPGMLLAQVYSFHKRDAMYEMPYILERGMLEYIFIGISMIWFFLRYSSMDYLGPFIYIIDMCIVLIDLYCLAIGRGVVSKIFESKQMVYLGSISMYIFLFHYNIRMYVDFIGRMLKIGSLPVGILQVVVILILTFIVSVGCQRVYRKRS